MGYGRPFYRPKMEFLEDFEDEVDEKEKNQKVTKEILKELLTDLWTRVGFTDFYEFFQNMAYLGALNSRINEYFIYSWKGYYLICAGIKPIVRFNILLHEEVEEIKGLIDDFNEECFTLPQIVAHIRKQEYKCERLGLYKKYKIESRFMDDLYALIMEACYILSIEGKLDLMTGEENIVFYKASKNSEVSKGDSSLNIFMDAKKVECESDLMILKNSKYYFITTHKLFRCYAYPYLIDEIELMNELLEIYDSGEQIFIKEILNKLDLTKRYNTFYQMIMEKNLRTERERFEYMDTRVRYALKLIAAIKGTVRMEKRGREQLFFKQDG